MEPMQSSTTVIHAPEHAISNDGGAADKSATRHAEKEAMLEYFTTKWSYLLNREVAEQIAEDLVRLEQK